MRSVLFHFLFHLFFACIISATENVSEIVVTSLPNVFAKQPQIAHSFAVANVKPKNFTRINQSIQNATQFISQNANLQMEFESGASNLDLIQSDVDLKHGLIATVLMAYSNHQPLAFSPDDFWLLIAQGIVQHIGGNNETAEFYRKLLVDHEEKRDLIVDATKYHIYPKIEQHKNRWPSIVSEIGELIRNNTKTKFCELITQSFSTTKGVEKTVFTGNLMETMKNFFSCRLMLQSGIPKIFLLGTPGDYQEILNRIDKLKRKLTDFHWYLDRVRAIMENVSASANGNADTNFWKRMIFKAKKRSASDGQKFFTGWLGELIPYVRGGEKRKRNEGRKTDLKNFNCAAASLTDFKLIDAQYTLKEYEMKLITGFLGPAWDERLEALRPAMGWALAYVGERPIKLVRNA